MPDERRSCQYAVRGRRSDATATRAGEPVEISRPAATPMIDNQEDGRWASRVGLLDRYMARDDRPR